MKNDIISRTAAIDAIKSLPITLDAETVQRCIEAISNMPSAQPSATDICVGGNLIDRQAAIDAICRDGVRLERGGTLMITISTAKQWAVDLLSDLPSAQPERKNGKWIEDGYDHYKAVCSECGEPCATYVMGKPRDKYCKWCGAKMDTEDG